MNPNESCDIDAFLTKFCPAVIQALYLLSLKWTLSAYQTEMACVDLTYIILVFFHSGKS